MATPIPRHPFRFSATVSPVVEREEWTARLRRLSDLGYATLTATDHVRSGGVWATVLGAATAAPAARVGPVVVNADLCHPVDIAREATTADVLTDGRVELGLGAGWDEADYAAHGSVGRPAARRVDRLAEAVAVIKELLAGHPVDFRGDHFSIRIDEHAALRPRQRRIPLLIGGGGARMLALAAEHADIVSVYRKLHHGHAGRWLAEDRDAFALRLAAVHSRITAREVPVELHVLLLRAIVTDRPDQERERVAEEHGLTVRELADSPHFAIGSAQEIADQLRARRAEWGISYFSVTRAEDQLAFSPVLAELVGG